MAEAAALLGVVAAGIQCAQAGLQVLIVGSSLRTKIQDAPEKVNQWLRQIEQLVALAELIKQTPANRLLSSLEPPSMLCSSAGSTTSWIESALLDCTSQAGAVQDLLKDMIHEVDDGRGRKVWKSILTLKREARIISALDGIERQKCMLNIWLGQNNLRQLDVLCKSAQDFHDGITKIDRYMLDTEKSFCKGFQHLSTALESSTSATASGFEGLINAGTANAKAIGQQMQHHHGELQVENSAMQLQLQNLTREMHLMKREVRKLANFRAQVSHAPSLLQNALQEQSKTSILPAEVGNIYKPRKKGSYNMVSEMCSCRITSRSGFWSLGANIQMILSNRDIHTEDFPLHQSRKQRFATIRYYAQTAILQNVIKLSFEATFGAGGFSMGVLLRTQRIVKQHYLKTFFMDLYHARYGKRYIHGGKPEDILLKLVERELWLAFSSGKATPHDVDSNGRNLIHLQIEYGRYCSKHMIYGRIIKILMSMGCRTDVLDATFQTPLQLMIENDSHRTSRLKYQIIVDEDVIEWTGINPHTTISGNLMLSYIRRWPESREDWGYPYISDIVLRKSKGDLESFISRGMKPVEVTPLRLTPLHLAAAANWAEGVTILLASGADKYTKDSRHLLPIDYALRNECLQTIELLLDGDCELYFPEDSRLQYGGLYASLLNAIFGKNRSIQITLARTFTQLGSCLGVSPVYYLLSMLSNHENPRIDLVDDFFAGGLHSLEARVINGKTLLMAACQENDGDFIKYLFDRGASPFTPHRDSAITAGYFLCGNNHWPHRRVNLEVDVKLLQAAFSVAHTVESDCRCSPTGFTPITALSRSRNRRKRQSFGEIVRCLQWSTHTIQQQARAFAITEIFDRLHMTHTCLRIREPSQKICREDRLEIEEEEEEFYEQLQELMEEYDLEQARFDGGPLEFMDFFFEMHELSLPSVVKYPMWELRDRSDKDILGPGVDYQSHRKSFTGKTIFYGHKEEVIEEDMLALLFRQ